MQGPFQLSLSVESLVQLFGLLETVFKEPISKTIDLSTLASPCHINLRETSQLMGNGSPGSKRLQDSDCLHIPRLQTCHDLDGRKLGDLELVSGHNATRVRHSGYILERPVCLDIQPPTGRDGRQHCGLICSGYCFPRHVDITHTLCLSPVVQDAEIGPSKHHLDSDHRQITQLRRDKGCMHAHVPAYKDVCGSPDWPFALNAPIEAWDWLSAGSLDLMLVEIAHCINNVALVVYNQ